MVDTTYNSDMVIINVSGLVKLLLKLGVLAVRPEFMLVTGIEMRDEMRPRHTEHHRGGGKSC